MAIAVYIPTPFRDLTAGLGRVSAHGATIAELIDNLDREYPGLGGRIRAGGAVHLHVNVFVNGQEMRSLANEATRLRDDDEVAFIPALAGGAEPIASGGTALGANRHGQLMMTSEQRARMIQHALIVGQEECCGLLYGKGNQVARVDWMENTEHSALNYRVHEPAYLRVDEAMRRIGLEHIGFYHSHTHSAAWPSPTDVRFASRGWPDFFQVIVSLKDRANPMLRAFRIDENGSIAEQEVVTR